VSADITVTDFFCGAGGSSSGMERVPGIRVRLASNHWKLAIETHNYNLPHADHDIADIAGVDPRRYARTDGAWFSPECTFWTMARGDRCDYDTDHVQLTLDGDDPHEPEPDEAKQRSRALMRDVVRFARHHHYRWVIVENVPDILKWVHLDRWLGEMPASRTTDMTNGLLVSGWRHWPTSHRSIVAVRHAPRTRTHRRTGGDAVSTPTMRLLSLGAGVQSTVLALMATDGTLPGLDGAVFADTGWEPARVYRHLDRLEQSLTAAGIPLYRVSKGNLRSDAIDSDHRYASVPYFVRNPDGSDGMGRRQCTSEYKLNPINRKVRELLGAQPPDFRRVPKGRVAEQWIGFSTDEITRISDSGVSYVRKRYPLLELGMTRSDCSRWLRSRGWTSVAKSACIGCPYHGNRQWRDLRDNQPNEWADAVEFDAQIRRGGARGLPLNGEAFLHRSRVPLSLAPIDRVTRAEWADRQGDLFDQDEDGDPDGCSPHGCRSGLPIEGAT
jgi:C-5 cytosine-specific DNA methylase